VPGGDGAKPHPSMAPVYHHPSDLDFCILIRRVLASPRHANQVAGISGIVRLTADQPPR